MKLTSVSVASALATARLDLWRTTLVVPAAWFAAATCVPLSASVMLGPDDATCRYNSPPLITAVPTNPPPTPPPATVTVPGAVPLTAVVLPEPMEISL